MPALPLNGLRKKLSQPAGRVVVLLARVLVASVFAWAAVPKLIDPDSFSQAIHNYHVLPDAWVGPFATTIPMFELLIALALVTGVQARGAALLSAIMFVIFAGAMGQALVRGINLDCGCFGSGSGNLSWWSVGRNAALMLISVIVALAPGTPWPWRWSKLREQSRT